MSKAKVVSLPACSADDDAFREKVLDKAIAETLRKHDKQIESELESLSGDASFRGWPLPEVVREFVSSQVDFLCDVVPKCKSADDLRGLMHNAVSSGFMLAIERYMHLLGEVPELKQLKVAEQARKATAITGKREAMLARAREAAAMVDRGDSIADVAAHFEVDKSRVYAWLRELQKQRL